MTVGELKILISNVPDETEIILQKDAEGNGFSPLSDADSNCIYLEDSSYSGNVYSLTWSADDVLMSEDEWNEMKKTPKCLVLSPVN